MNTPARAATMAAPVGVTSSPWTGAGTSSIPAAEHRLATAGTGMGAGTAPIDVAARMRGMW